MENNSILDFEYEFDFLQGCEFTADEFHIYCEIFHKNTNQSIIDHGYFRPSIENGKTNSLQLPSEPNDELGELLDLLEEIINPQTEMEQDEEEITCEIVPYDDTAVYIDDVNYSFSQLNIN